MFRICSIPVKDYQNGERHVKRLKLQNVPTGWIRVAVTVESSQGVEEPPASIGSQVLHLRVSLDLSGQDISTIF